MPGLVEPKLNIGAGAWLAVVVGNGAENIDDTVDVAVETTGDGAPNLNIDDAVFVVGAPNIRGAAAELVTVGAEAPKMVGGGFAKIEGATDEVVEVGAGAPNTGAGALESLAGVLPKVKDVEKLEEVGKAGGGFAMKPALEVAAGFTVAEGSGNFAIDWAGGGGKPKLEVVVLAAALDAGVPNVNDGIAEELTGPLVVTGADEKAGVNPLKVELCVEVKEGIVLLPAGVAEAVVVGSPNVKAGADEVLVDETGGCRAVEYAGGGAVRLVEIMGDDDTLGETIGETIAEGVTEVTVVAATPRLGLLAVVTATEKIGLVTVVVGVLFSIQTAVGVPNNPESVDVASTVLDVEGVNVNDAVTAVATEVAEG